MFKTQQADSELHEDQLLNFLVNQLDEEVALDLANNAEIDSEYIRGPRRRNRRRDLDLYAVQLQQRLATGEHDPIPSSDEVRAGTAQTSR